MAAAEENEEGQPTPAHRAGDDRSTASAQHPAQPGRAAGTDSPDDSPAADDEVTTSESAGSGTGRKPRHPVRSFLRESAIVVVSALVLSLVIKTFLAQAFYIPSVSMEPTLMVGDRLRSEEHTSELQSRGHL